MKLEGELNSIRSELASESKKLQEKTTEHQLEVQKSGQLSERLNAVQIEYHSVKEAKETLI